MFFPLSLTDQMLKVLQCGFQVVEFAKFAHLSSDSFPIRFAVKDKFSPACDLLLIAKFENDYGMLPAGCETLTGTTLL